ncbi:MAG: hypothetical protein H6918_02580 [Sphingomonadaceae bacterium]|nr:hypothetical protein [Sphingomonadaceae bacterium]
MPRSARLSLLIALLALVTLAPKTIAYGVQAKPDKAGLYAQVERRLTGRGLAFRHVDHPFLAHLRIEGEGCRALLAELDPNGTTVARLGVEARDIGPGAILYRGKRVKRIPPILPAIKARLQRDLALYGIETERDPVLWLAQTPGCRLEPEELGGVEIFIED